LSVDDLERCILFCVYIRVIPAHTCIDVCTDISVMIRLCLQSTYHYTTTASIDTKRTILKTHFYRR